MAITKSLLLFQFILALYSSSLWTSMQYNISRTLIVDVHGSGKYTNVQSAIDAVYDLSKSKTLIIVKSGSYREKVTVNEKKTNVILRGSGYDKTSIEWNDNSKTANGSTFRSFSFAVFAENFTAYNISFKNNAPEPNPGQKDGQAVAMRIEGEQAAFYGCGFYGFQDTLLDNKGKHFFKECFIQGSIDFICGNGRSLYQDCIINSVARSSKSRVTGYITAQRRASEKDKTGFSFVNCKIDGTGKVLLGRAWGPYARVVFSNTYMSGIISPTGWNDMDDATKQKTVTFGEHRCHGPGADFKERVWYGKQLTDAQASFYTNISFIEGDQWLPHLELRS